MVVSVPTGRFGRNIVVVWGANERVQVTARDANQWRDRVGTVRRSLTHVSTTREWGFYRALARAMPDVRA